MSVLMNTHTLQIFCSRNLPQITRLNNSPATENHLPLTPIISQSSLSRCVCVCVCVSDTWSGPVRGRSLGDWGRRTIKRPKFVLISQKRLPFDPDCTLKSGLPVQCSVMLVFSIADPIVSDWLCDKIASVCFSLCRTLWKGQRTGSRAHRSSAVKFLSFPSVVSGSSPGATCGLCPFIPD